MKTLNEVVINNEEEQEIDESLLVIGAFVAAPFLIHFITKAFNNLGHGLDAFWAWTFDTKNTWNPLS